MRGVVVGLLIFLGVVTAHAQIRSVKLLTPRLFGYFVGDVLHSEVDIVVDKDVDLVFGSVPKPGPLNSWLDIIGSGIEESTSADTKLYRLHLDYQNFYPALDSRTIDIPGFTLSFISGGKSLSANVPGWSFLISALREVLPPPKPSGADYLQADVRPPTISLRRDRIATFGFLAATLVALVWLAYHLAWWPFQSRPNRPFTQAARRVRHLLATQRDTGYRDALLTLHRAVDATAGHAVFAEDVPDFLEQAPAFSRLKQEFDRFFDSSRRAFFANDLGAAAADFSPGELRQFSDHLAAVERTAR